MEENRNCIQDLEAMRVSMHKFVHNTLPIVTKDLLKYAEDLDKDYKDIKISKVAGQSGCVVGGILSTVGFALSFFTFGASLGLNIAGAVIGGFGGVTSGGASIANCVKGRNAKMKAELQIEVYKEELSKLLESCKLISDKFERLGNIDRRFPFWCEFWGKILYNSGNVVTDFSLNMVATTVINELQLKKTVHTATGITSSAVPVFRTLGHAFQVYHIAGGVVRGAILPLDVYSLVSNSVQLHKNEPHGESKRIRQVVSEMQDRCPKKEEIDDMIDKCIAALEQ